MYRIEISGQGSSWRRWWSATTWWDTKQSANYYLRNCEPDGLVHLNQTRLEIWLSYRPSPPSTWIGRHLLAPVWDLDLRVPTLKLFHNQELVPLPHPEHPLNPSPHFHALSADFLSSKTRHVFSSSMPLPVYLRPAQNPLPRLSRIFRVSLSRILASLCSVSIGAQLADDLCSYFDFTAI